MGYRSVLLFGPPGSGKGTWGDIFRRLPGFYHVSTGEMFRELSPDTEIGRLVFSRINRGELVPDQEAVALWREHMQGLVDAGVFVPDRQYLVLDGLPRTPKQAALVAGDLEVMVILRLDCPDREMLVERLMSRASRENRPDDGEEEVIRKRFRIYDAQTAATLDAYPVELVRTIDVSRPPHVIFRDIGQALVDQLGTG